MLGENGHNGGREMGMESLAVTCQVVGLGEVELVVAVAQTMGNWTLVVAAAVAALEGAVEEQMDHWAEGMQLVLRGIWRRQPYSM